MRRWGERLVTLLVLVSHIACDSVADSPDTCPANCTALASDQCFSETAAYVASVVSRQAALPVGPGVDRGLQGFLESKTSELLSQCFPNAAVQLRPLRLLVISGIETFGATVLQQFTAATGINVVVRSLPTSDLVNVILQQTAANVSREMEHCDAPQSAPCPSLGRPFEPDQLAATSENARDH
ncbi:hypothetical protein HaLaN_07333 [Haematococcus lacustris]|uniref:Uncharacterized protein n=1 Tax=Haematococcus lacustris TaxID=44745 RepID=A0A699YNB3_HAELA|nr:hypothetical protein HaLaN_07333 [Haematococcus lacustris]